MIVIYGIATYIDLCTEIEIAETRIEGLEGQKKALMKLLGAPDEMGAQQYSDMPTGSHNYMSIDRLVDSIRKIDNMLLIEEGLLKGMIITKTNINAKLKGLEGIQYKVIYKREIENKSLNRIAEELNYSVRQISRIIEKVAK